jgi:single-stranded-DNA-specific exonuclease
MKYQWNLPDGAPTAAETLRERLPISPLLCGLLARRGVSTYEEAKAFFRPGPDQLHDPQQMCDMPRAVERLQRAVRGGERILLYGDYDVDGVTSVALLYRFLQSLGVSLDYYLPDRLTEGYGLSNPGVDYAVDRGAQLMIALDCGITALEQARYARERGLDLIICDHHRPGETLPEAYAVLNPKRSDCPYPYKELSGCAIGLKLAQAYAAAEGLPDERWTALLDLVALSLSCDLVELQGENRTLVALGLKRFNEAPCAGLKALMPYAARNHPLVVSDMVFGFGPFINAAGRMGHAKEALHLLLSADERTAKALALGLQNRNRHRKSLEQQAAKEALELARALETRRSAVLHRVHWHQGVVGIVAARLVDALHRPVIVFGGTGDTITGSARSIQQVDVFAAIGECRDLVQSFGGHTYAAGVTLNRSDLPAFAERFERAVLAQRPGEAPRRALAVDAEIELSDLTPAFLGILQQFEPWGPGNMRPLFLARGLQSTELRILKGEHLSLTVRQGESAPMEAIGFFQKEIRETVRPGQLFDAVFAVLRDTWRGEARIKLELRDVRPAEEAL